MIFAKQTFTMKLYIIGSTFLMILFFSSIPFGIQQISKHIKLSNCKNAIITPQNCNCGSSKNPPLYGWEIKLAF